MKLLVSNVGSTSLKFKLFEMPQEQVLCQAKVERVGSSSAIYAYKNLVNGAVIEKDGLDIPSYSEGIALFLSHMTDSELGVIASIEDIGGIGFKTVLSMGYYGVHELDAKVMEGMKESLFVAPVHNAAYIEAIGQFKTLLPDTPMIGVFETAFHQSIPMERRIYSVPYEWGEKDGLLRMGYHGASHSYAAQQAKLNGRADRVISCHLGGSCSICAIENGCSVDTSFGFSLQTGVMHANRCGDIDPYTVPYLMHRGYSQEEIMQGLSKRGGLLGISGVSNDLREVQQAAEAGNGRAMLAIKAFVHDIVKYIGAFYAELGGLDQLIFTGGIGENSALVREMVCTGLEHMGIILDSEANKSCRDGCISTAGSPVGIYVLPANEELGIARSSYKYLNSAGTAL